MKGGKGGKEGGKRKRKETTRNLTAMPPKSHQKYTATFWWSWCWYFCLLFVFVVYCLCFCLCLVYCIYLCLLFVFTPNAQFELKENSGQSMQNKKKHHKKLQKRSRRCRSTLCDARTRSRVSFADHLRIHPLRQHSVCFTMRVFWCFADSWCDSFRHCLVTRCSSVIFLLLVLVLVRLEHIWHLQ